MEIAIITDNSEKWIDKVLKRLYAYLDLPTVKFIFIDNTSKDNTVPKIVGIIGDRFLEEERFLFYINTKKKTDEELNNMLSKVANNQKCAIIKKNMNKRQLDRLIRSKLNDTN